MRRTQVLLDERTYHALKDEAQRRGTSVSAVLRGLVTEHLVEKQPKRVLRVEDFTFVGSGSSGQKPGEPLYPISHNHDEALVEGMVAEMSEDRYQ